MKIIFRILVTAIAVVLTAYIVPGVVVAGLGTALLVALVLGIINVTIRPILWLLTLPLTLITLGLFTFILNALLFWLTGLLVPGFHVYGFLAALLGSLIVSIFSALGNHLIRSNH